MLLRYGYTLILLVMHCDTGKAMIHAHIAAQVYYDTSRYFQCVSWFRTSLTRQLMPGNNSGTSSQLLVRFSAMPRYDQNKELSAVWLAVDLQHEMYFNATQL